MKTMAQVIAGFAMPEFATVSSVGTLTQRPWAPMSTELVAGHVRAARTKERGNMRVEME